MGDRLNWSESCPLLGRRILITRPREQSEDLRVRLCELGAEVISLPTIEICDPESWEPLDEAIKHIARYTWLLFTSVNGVRRFFARWKLAGMNVRELHRLQICVIGAATGKAVTNLGLESQIIPDEYRAEGLLDSLKGRILPGTRILIPRAKVARDILPETLRSWGAEVDVLEAYQTLPAHNNRDDFFQAISERRIDLVTFTSSSSVASLAELVAPKSLRELLDDVAIASIGPVTSETVEKHGLKVSVQPDRYDIPSLVEAIRCHYEVCT